MFELSIFTSLYILYNRGKLETSYIFETLAINFVFLLMRLLFIYVMYFVANFSEGFLLRRNFLNPLLLTDGSDNMRLFIILNNYFLEQFLILYSSLHCALVFVLIFLHTLLVKYTVFHQGLCL